MLDWRDVLLELFRFVVVSGWRSSIMALLLLLILWCGRRRLSPRSRMCLWGLLIVRLICPLTVPSGWSVFNAVDVPTAWLGEAKIETEPVADVRIEWGAAIETAEPPVPLLTTHAVRPVAPRRWSSYFTAERTLTAMAGSWVIGAAAMFVMTGLAVCRFRRRIARQPKCDADVMELLDACRRQLGMQRTVRLVVSDAVATPAVTGLWRPVLILPPDVLRGVDRDQLRLILLHELIHVQRGDVLWNWLLTCLRIAHWFNPLLRLAFRKFDRERELCCDEQVLRAVGSGHTRQYAQTILRVLELCQHRFVTRPTLPAGTTGMADGLTSSHALAERMSHMLQISRGRRYEWKLGLGTVLLLAVVGLTNGADEPPPPVPVTEVPPALDSAVILPQPLSEEELRKLPRRSHVYGGAAPVPTPLHPETNEKPILVVYSVAHLLESRRDGNTERPALTRDQVFDLVRMHAAPESWKAFGHLKWGVEDQLVVRHVRTVLNQIRESLSHADLYGLAVVEVELEIYTGEVSALAEFGIAWTTPHSPAESARTALNIASDKGTITADDGSVLRFDELQLRLVGGDLVIENSPLKFGMLEADKAATLRKTLRQSSTVTLLSAPTIRTQCGRTATVLVGGLRPFVVALEGEEQKPVVRNIEEGTAARVRPTLREQGTIHLDLGIEHSEIVDVKKETTAGTAGGTITIQVPVVTQRKVATTVDVPKDRILVLQSPAANAGEGKSETLLLIIQPRVVEDILGQ